MSRCSTSSSAAATAHGARGVPGPRGRRRGQPTPPRRRLPAARSSRRRLAPPQHPRVAGLRSVTCAASRCSSSACANLRDVPSSSRSSRDRDRALALDDARRPRSRISASGPGGSAGLGPRAPRGRRLAAPGARPPSSPSARLDRRLEAGLAQPLFEREGAGRERLRGLGLRRGRAARAAPARPAPPRQPLQPRERSRDGPCLRGGRVEDDASPERVGRGDRAQHEPVAGGRRRAAARGGAGRSRPPSVGNRARRSRASRGGPGCDRRAPAARSRRRSARRRCDSSARSAAPGAASTSPRLDLVAVDPHEVQRDPLPGGARVRPARRAPEHRARARASPAAGSRFRRPRPTAPDHSVPVTTVPAPLSVNDRSTWSRAGPSPAAREAARRRLGRARRGARRAPRRAAPRPATISTPGAAARAASAAAAAGSARSALRDRHHPGGDAQARQHRRVLARLRHHAVVGRDVIRNRSMPVAPATIVRTNRSWPGTSTTDSSPARRERHWRVAERDRDAALASPPATDRFAAGERADQRGLAVVDVARRCRA